MEEIGKINLKKSITFVSEFVPTMGMSKLHEELIKEKHSAFLKAVADFGKLHQMTKLPRKTKKLNLSCNENSLEKRRN